MIKILCKKMHMVNSEYISIGKGYLAGLLGAITVFAVIQVIHPEPSRLGTVNITGIVDHFVKEESSKTIPQEQLKKEIKAFGVRLENELTAFSKAHHLTLLPSESVISGSRDYTGIIIERLAKITKEDGG